MLGKLHEATKTLDSHTPVFGRGELQLESVMVVAQWDRRSVGQVGHRLRWIRRVKPSVASVAQLGLSKHPKQIPEFSRLNSLHLHVFLLFFKP